MHDQALIQEGINYATRNFLSENTHLALDKKFIKKHFDLNGKDVLDFGCGMGSMSLWMAKELGCKVDGYDLDDNHIFIAKELYKQYPLENVQFSIRNIIEDPIEKQYDFIVLNDVIEHIKEEWIAHILDTLIKKNLKKGGAMFFSYPPWEGPYASHMQRIIHIPWLQYLPQKWVLKKISEKNQKTVGRFDLVNEYLELNHMTHQKLIAFLKPFGLQQIYRKSHTKLNKLPFLKNINFNFFLFKFLVTKELVVFKKI